MTAGEREAEYQSEKAGEWCSSSMACGYNTHRTWRGNEISRNLSEVKCAKGSKGWLGCLKKN